MNTKTISLNYTLSYLGFGINLLLIPNLFLTFFGCPLDKHGEMVARTFAAALIGSSVLHYLFRNIDIKEKAWTFLLVFNIVLNIISAPVMAVATFNGVMNVFGYFPVILNLILVVLAMISIFNFKKIPIE